MLKFLGTGCLQDQQSIELIMVCRWLSPVVLFAACLLAWPLTCTVSPLLKKPAMTKIQNFAEALSFGVGNALMFMAELYVLFSLSTVRTSANLMIWRQENRGSQVGAE